MGPQRLMAGLMDTLRPEPAQLPPLPSLGIYPATSTLLFGIKNNAGGPQEELTP